MSQGRLAISSSSTRRRAISMVRLAGLAAVIGICTYVAVGRRNDDNKKVFKEMRTGLASLPAYKANAEYLDQLLAREHPAAFSAAYSMGGRRTSAKFDADKYRTTVLENMAKDCDRSGKKDLANQLRLLNALSAKPTE